MELNRLARVLRDRWRIAALIAVIGFISAFGLTYLSNQSVEERWEALIPLRFDLQEGETVEDLTARINEAQAQASLAAENLIDANQGSTIFADTATGRLFFRAEADTQEVARERARALLDAYVNSDQGGGNVQEQLDALEENAEAVAAEIDEMESTLTPEEQTLVSRHQTLDAAIAAVRDRIVGLIVADAGATQAEQAENAAIRADLEETLDELLAEKEALGPVPSADLSASEQLRLDSLRRQLEVIGVEYQRLSLRTVGVLAENAQEELPQINSLTPTPASPIRNGVIGFLGGVGLAVFALVFVTRSRKEVWLADDLPVPVLGEIPDRKVTTLPGPSWYDTVTEGRRKESIQAVRTTIEGALGHEFAALAIVGDRVGSVATHALAVDLAASFASAGRSTLLIGADYSTQVEMTEFEVGEPTLRTVLSIPLTSAQKTDERLHAIALDAVEIRANLAVIPSGEAPDSPADALAGQRFRRFIEIAQERFDLVIVAGGEGESASSQVITQRIGAAIVAIAPGKTTVPRINSVLVDMSHQRVALPGVIMVYGTESRFSLPQPSILSPGQSTTTPRQVEESISRLDRYPFPGAKRTPSPRSGSLDHLAEGLAGSRRAQEPSPLDQNADADQVATQVLEALQNIDSELAYEPVAEYLVARVEDMMTAVPGQANVSQEMVDVATDIGFVPLISVRGVPTVWERFVSELTAEIGDDIGRQLASRISEVITGEEGVDSSAVDHWLGEEFFSRHVERTDREPVVWHLASSLGTIQVLVNGRRLTDERLGQMTTDIVRPKIAELERAVRDMRTAEKEHEASRIETALKDARTFEVSLAALRGGTKDEARLVYPWRRHDQMPRGWQPIWSEGIRPNIAPLQRLELLTEPVLTDDELRDLAPTG